MGSHYIQGDLEDEVTRMKIKEYFNFDNVDVVPLSLTYFSNIKVLSDMAPNFTGDQDTDHMGISVLNAIALRVCMHNLRAGGSLIMKTLNGAMEKNFFVLNCHL